MNDIMASGVENIVITASTREHDNGGNSVKIVKNASFMELCRRIF
jgi:hypothetical protein